ncbi:MAG TPA: ATP-binding protein [Actinocatenispora sp.]
MIAYVAMLILLALFGILVLQRGQRRRQDRTSRALPQRLAVRYFDDTVLLTDTEAWAYFKLPTISVEFRTAEEWDRVIQAHAHAFAGLSDAKIHLRTVFREYETTRWAEALDGRTPNGSPGWPELLVAQQQHLRDQQFLQKEVFLGVRLGVRRDEATGALRSAFQTLRRWVTAATDAVLEEDEQIDLREIKKWRGAAAPVVRLMERSTFAATPATPDEIAWLFRHQMHPVMPLPPDPGKPNRPWGRGEVQHLIEGIVDNGESPYCLAITQPNWNYQKQLEAHRQDPQNWPEPEHVFTSYTATLCVSRIPREIDTWDANPWIHHAEHPSLGFPVEFSAYWEIHPPRRVKKDVEKRLQRVSSQRDHIHGAGAEIPTGIEDAFTDGRQLDVDIERNRKHLGYGAGRLIVSAATRDELTRRCELLIEHYRNIGVDVAWTPNDQLRLFMEHFPGDRVRLKVRAYRQVQELETITAGLFTASNSLGDGEGPYLGRTTGRSQEIVFFDPLYAPRNNKPPGVAIVGAPGGGKTFTTLTIAYQMASRGITTVVLDPKGDAKGLATIAGLGDVRILELGADMAGLLDPFSLAESREASVLLAMETMRLLLGGELTAERENAVVGAIRHVSMQPEPNLHKAVQLLLEGGVEKLNPVRSTYVDQQMAIARSVGSLLEVISELPLGNLCFSAARTDVKLARNRLSIITLAGLSLPTAHTPVDNYTYAQRLSVTLLYLVTHYTRALVTDPMYTGPKALIIDEAWAITQTQQGAQLVAEVARLGRSRNTALVLVSQNARDLLAEDVRNCITSMFVFRSEDWDEIAADIDLLRISDNPEHRNVIASLPTGANSECIMRDVRGHVGTMRVDLSYLSNVVTAFDSTPDDGSGRIQSAARRIVTDGTGRYLGVADTATEADALRRAATAEQAGTAPQPRVTGVASVPATGRNPT